MAGGIQFPTPGCPWCKGRSDRIEIRKVGIVGEVVKAPSRKGKTAQTVPLVLYQCMGCKAIVLTEGELKPTGNPLALIPKMPESQMTKEDVEDADA